MLEITCHVSFVLPLCVWVFWFNSLFPLVVFNMHFYFCSHLSESEWLDADAYYNCVLAFVLVSVISEFDIF